MIPGVGPGAAGTDAVPGSEGYEIDEVRDADVETVVALWRACDLTRPWNDPYRDLADARATSTATVLVLRPVPPALPGATGAARVQEPVGSVMAGFDGHRGWLYYLAVDPAERDAGHGRRLVVAAEAWLAAQGALKVQLMVRQANETVVGFYTAMGYTDAQCVVLGRRLP